MHLLQNVRLVHKGHLLHGKAVDILLENGKIGAIGPGGTLTAPTGIQVVAATGLHVSLGWTDLYCSLNDPGYEQRQTLHSLAASGLRGGFTHLVVQPNTQPPIDHAEAVTALLARSEALPVTLLPMGAGTEKIAGADMAEVADMQAAGAAAFGDGRRAIQSTGVLSRLLRYLQPLNALLVQLPLNKDLEAGGVANESATITALGLKPSPALAETMMVAQCIELLRHTGGRLHLQPITSRHSLPLLRAAQDEGLQLSAGTTPAYLYFTDEKATDFDTRYKLRPPLRTEADRQALLEAIADGTLSVISSGHTPTLLDEKRLEWDYAENGMPMLETAYVCALTALKGYTDADHVVEALSLAPRRLLGMPIPELKPGDHVCLTLFLPEERTVIRPGMLHTPYNGNPLTGHTLQGRVWGTYHQGHLYSVD